MEVVAAEMLAQQVMKVKLINQWTMEAQEFVQQMKVGLGSL